jgi:general secretion pathway protein H
MRGFRNAGGFSLLEVVMVILIMSLTLAVSYPVLSRGTSSLHLRASGRDILNLMRYAREKAITEQTGMMIVADRDTKKVVLSSDLGQGVHSVSLPKDVKIEKLLFSGKEVPEGSLLIRFLSNGSSDSAEILLVADNGARLRVFTDPVTGGARIQLGSGESSP